MAVRVRGEKACMRRRKQTDAVDLYMYVRTVRTLRVLAKARSQTRAPPARARPSCRDDGQECVTPANAYSYHVLMLDLSLRHSQ